MFTISQQSLGAQILQATWKGRDIFFLSDTPLPCRRGGVPILFPQFSTRGPLQKHGFARTLEWYPVGDGGVMQCGMSQRTDWPHEACLQFSHDFDESRGILILTLRVKNLWETPLPWTGGLHPYFALDLSRACVHGLQGVACEDLFTPSLVRDLDTSLRFNGAAFERLYRGAPDIRIETPDHSLFLHTEGFTEWMVWNPGREAKMEGLSEGQWKEFLCVEPVCAQRPHLLAPKEVFTGSLYIRIGE